MRLLMLPFFFLHPTGVILLILKTNDLSKEKLMISLIDSMENICFPS